jgi:hypothetical protein
MAVSLVIAGTLRSQADYAFTPIALLPASYNQDGIVEASVRSRPPATTATMDYGTNNNGYTWYEQGANAAAPSTGLPPAGSTFTSQSQPDHQFRMPPDYTTNNAFMVNQYQIPAATITLATPAVFSALSFLSSSAYGGGYGDVDIVGSVNHADGTSEGFDFVSPDWFDSFQGDFVALGRIYLPSQTFATYPSSVPQLFSSDLLLTNVSSPVTSINLYYGYSSFGSANACVMALSGSSGGAFTPVTVTGYNEDIVVGVGEAYTITTATMSGGRANQGITWYERGFAPSAPATGVPPAGSTITNALASYYTYKLAPSYTTNDVVYIDATAVGVIAPAMPTNYFALSFLGAGSKAVSFGGPVQLDCTVSHADGTAEFGTLSVLSWFEGGSVAWPVNGAVNVGNFSTSTSATALYAMDLILTNNYSPVTNILLSYDPANAVPASQVMIFAVSGVTAPAQPLAVTTQPITLTPGSYNQDGIIELAAPHMSSPLATTASLDQGTNNTGYTWYEQGYNPAYPASGLPTAGSVFITNGYTFKMPASYASNNAVLINHFQIPQATITLNTPAAYSTLSFLNSSGFGPVGVNYTVHHADASVDTGTFSSTDWFNTLSAPALIVLGRVSPLTRTLQTFVSNIPRLYSSDVSLANVSSPVASIDLSYASGNGNVCLLALTGDYTNSIAFTGYNADMVVEAPPPLNGSYTTASLDQGRTNTGYSLAEQGYIPWAPAAGVPPAGSTITNISARDHTYILPSSYAGNDVAYIDSSKTASLVPGAPAAYSSLSFLGAAGHGPLLIDWLASHADGTSEGGTLTVPDWLGSGTLAWIVNSRVDVRSGGVQPWTIGGPALFSMDVALSNSSSPITNIVLSYDSSNTGSTGQVMILAVSGAPAATPPPPVILTIQPLPGGQLQLQWSRGVLLEANDLAGPWITNSAASPYRLVPSSPRKFYRALVR